MSKRKHREKDDESSADSPAKEEAIVADPPQPNATFLAVTAGLYLAWLAFLIWMALAR